MPLVINEVFGHTVRMLRMTTYANKARTEEAMRTLKRIWSLVAVFLTVLAMSVASMASFEQQADPETRKKLLNNHIKKAAAETYDIHPSLVVPRLDDRRLVIPVCADEIKVTFPFKDRSTTQVVCTDPEWKIFIQIRLMHGIPAFAYQSGLDEGSSLKRSDVVRKIHSKSSDSEDLITILSDVLDKPLILKVEAGELLRERHFGLAKNKTPNRGGNIPTKGWVAIKTIPRGNRLNRKSFELQVLEGRTPSDLIHEGAQFDLLEATRNLMPGDILRQSAVKLAPAVRKGEELLITVARGGVQVTNLVRATRDASLGETIEVINKESGRSLNAKVVGIRKLELIR
jgi:flagella basal body P-ring formation protein FlgA